jgi:inosine-uridine nucleoside N-ribohydrolase
MQAAPEEQAPIGLVLDGEMRGDPADLIALAMAFGLSRLEKPECELLSLSLTGSSLEGAAFTEAVARFYTLIALRDFPEEYRRYRGLPIGLDDSGHMAASAPALAKLLARKDSEGEPLYGHEVREMTDTADPAALIRNGLTAQQDQNSVVVLNGPATNLARVLALQGGPELIAAKVKLLVVVLGDLPSPAPDAHVKADPAAARELFTKWPSPIVAAGERRVPAPGPPLPHGRYSPSH